MITKRFKLFVFILFITFMAFVGGMLVLSFVNPELLKEIFSHSF